MRLVKTASGKKTLKISKSEWQRIGKLAGWDFEVDFTETGDPIGENAQKGRVALTNGVSYSKKDVLGYFDSEDEAIEFAKENYPNTKNLSVVDARELD